jgi:L-aspartate oxidase
MDAPYLQRRYLLSFDTRKLPHIFTDVLVVGSGVAGLRAAIEAAAAGREVILATNREATESNSFYAQGGAAAVLDAADTIQAHVADTLATGCGMCDEPIVRRVISEAPRSIEQMREWGTEFDAGPGGGLELGREGGHSASRIVHAHGDATGRALVQTLLERARASEGLKIFEECSVIDLLTDPPTGGNGSTCTGALTHHPRYGLQVIHARCTVLAAGGAGVLWRETTNPAVAAASAIALGFRAGATIADAEMMQFHPTTLYVAGATRSLISEAVRGEGAYLVDREGRRFMDEYHERGELAARDVVSRAILDHMVRTNATQVYLDVRHIGGKRFAERFPQIDRLCRSFEIDPGEDLIPVRPAAHYMIGGVWVEPSGRTSLHGLLACGEAACTGLHGANRLASNSLIEALIFGRQCGILAAESAAEAANGASTPRIQWTNPASDRTELDLADIRNSLRSIMWRNVGVVRRGERLAETQEIVAFWGRYVMDKEIFNPAGWEIQNLLTGAYVVTEAALRRTESRGVHYREDFPESDPMWQRHQFIRRSEHQLVVG